MPSTSFSPSMTTTVMMVVRGLLLARHQGSPREVGVDFGHCAHSFGPTLSEYHPSVWSYVFRILDEPEPAGGLVSCPEMFAVHRDDGGSLPSAATMH